MSVQVRILVVDDEVELTSVLQEYLGANGFLVQTALNATQAKVLVTSKAPDLALLDIRMPGEDGLSLARWLRDQYPAVGVVMLTTAADVVDRIVGLEMGADDYIGKPFDMRELLARIKSVLRRRESATTRSTPLQPGCVAFGSTVLNLASRKLYDASGTEIPITAMEYDLLRVFADHPNAVLNRDSLMELAHHKGWDVFDRSIDLRVMRLRRKIEADPEKPEIIKTIRGAGYMYIAP